MKRVRDLFGKSTLEMSQLWRQQMGAYNRKLAQAIRLRRPIIEPPPPPEEAPSWGFRVVNDRHVPEGEIHIIDENRIAVADHGIWVNASYQHFTAYPNIYYIAYSPGQPIRYEPPVEPEEMLAFDDVRDAYQENE